MISALLGKYWMVPVALVLAVGIYQSGVNAERNRGEAATLRVQIETMRLDKKIADRSLVRVADDAAALELARKADEEKIDQLQEIIRSRADRGLNQSELDGLLGIK